MTRDELYKMALETRNFEIKLFWERSNYFLVLTTAIAIGYFSLEDRITCIIVAFLGLLVSILWFRVNLGGKFWQSRWEGRLCLLETGMKRDINFFPIPTSSESTDNDTKVILNDPKHNRFRKFIDSLVLRKPSVSFAMILLSIVFMAFWLFFSLYSLVRPEQSRKQPITVVVTTSLDSTTIRFIEHSIKDSQTSLKEYVDKSLLPNVKKESRKHK